MTEQHDPDKMQTGHVLADFLRHEAGAGVRAQLLEAIGAVGDGQRYFAYNAHNLRIDGEHGLVTVEDELDIGREETVDAAEFVHLLSKPTGVDRGCSVRRSMR